MLRLSGGRPIEDQQTVDCWYPSFSDRRPADMERPPGRRDISRIIDHISSPPQDTPV